MSVVRTFAATGFAALAAVTLVPRAAQACGCFAPPDPSVPVVQAGERILFSHDSGEITAHIQIQYEGEASEFGWLLPLPSVPTLELGVEELFNQLIAQTQPRYRLLRQADDTCLDFSVFAPTAGNESQNDRFDSDDPNSVVVIEDSIGPFDFAVLRADSREPMFDWLRDNRYVIPNGTEDAVGPYIHDGAYFLALKLRKGNDVGDIQPVVVRYKSDLPMIPIILTSVAANPDMGIQVWVLGDSRAIPRNYRHTVINEEYIDWFNAGINYNEVVINATNEAEDGQSFVTEYAGPSDVMRGVLNWEGRFGERSAFESETDPGRFVEMLRVNGFVWSPGLISLLRRTFPMPDALIEQRISEDLYYESLDFYLNTFRERNPGLFEDVDLSFDAIEVTEELWTRIVEPTLAAGALFDAYGKLTRLYTTLSPNEMTRDPVFSFNPSLPDVDNNHAATFTFDCEDPSRGVLRLPDGRQFFVNDGNDWIDRDRQGIPYSQRIETLREEGGPEVVVDNTTRVSPSDVDSGGCGCSAAGEPSSAPAAIGALLAAVVFVWRRRRA